MHALPMECGYRVRILLSSTSTGLSVFASEVIRPRLV